MKELKFFLICENYECSKYQKPQELQVERPFSFMCDSFCKDCYRRSRISIKFGKEEFSSFDALDHYLLGLKKEYELIKRLITGSIAQEKDKERFRELKELLEGTRCSCCGSPYLDETESN